MHSEPLYLLHLISRCSKSSKSLKCAQKVIIIDPFFPGIICSYSGGVIGHYTQLVWAETYRIGCGFARHGARGGFGGTALYVCDYGPGGNMMGKPVYMSGPACTQCPDGTTCVNSLCSEGSVGNHYTDC